MTLSALPTEVLYRIIDSFLLYPQRHPGNCWLDLDDRLDVDVRANRQSLIALSVVNKRIGNVARNALWHAITLPYLSERTVSTLNPMTSNSMEIQWQRNLDLTIAANPARASVTQALYLRQISDAGRLESTLSPFVNLRLLHLDCIHLSASVSRVLSDIFQSLDRLRNFVFDCSEVPAERVFELLSMLPTSRTYDGVRFLDITFPKECSLVVRIRSLFIDGDCSDDSQLHIDFLEKLDRSVLEDLTLQLGIDRPADSIERILSLGWPALTRLAIKGDEYEGLPTGWARPEDRPKLRTLELEGIRPKPENLYLDNFGLGDTLGIAALLRLLRQPERPLRNIRFICFPFEELMGWPGDCDMEQALSVEEALDLAEELEKVAHSAGIRIEPPNLRQAVEDGLRRWANQIVEDGE